MLLFGTSTFAVTCMIADEVRIKADWDVYGLREDSYLLAEAVEKRAFGSVLDMGTGSGIEGIIAAKMGCAVTFADISQKALDCARANAEANLVGGTFVKTDLFSNVDSRFNTIVFNPPYLHSGPFAKSTKRDTSLDGGIDGRELIDRFLLGFNDHVEPEHTVLLLESSLNRYEKDIKKLNATVVCTKRMFFEELAVLVFK